MTKYEEILPCDHLYIVYTFIFARRQMQRVNDDVVYFARHADFVRNQLKLHDIIAEDDEDIVPRSGRLLVAEQNC